MPGESSVLVRLRLLGSTAFARGAARDAEALGALGASATGAAAKLRGVAGAMGTAGGAALGAARFVKRLALPVAVIAGVSAKMAMDFQQAMELVHTQAGASQREVDRLSGSVLNLAKHAKQGPTELANALYRIEGAGLRGNKAMSALTAASKLAAVGNADVEDTAKTLSQAWFSGIKGAGNFNHTVAELNATVGAGDLRLQQLVDALGTGILPVAKNAGLQMRDITGVLSVFGDETNNVSGWTAQLATALHYLYAPTAKAETALNGIGLSGNQLGKDFRKKRGLLTAMLDLRKHLDKLPGGFRGLKAAQTLSTILPGGRGRVLNVLLGQLDRYQAKLKQVGDTTGNFGDSVAKTQETSAFRVHAAWSTIQVAMIKLGGHIMPLAASAFEGFASLVDKASGAMERFGQSKVGHAASGFIAGLSGKGPGATPRGPRAPGRAMEPGHARASSAAQAQGGAVRSAIGGVIAFASAQLPKLGKILMNAGKQLIDALKPAMPFFTNVLLPLLKGIGMGILGSVVAAFRVAIPIIKVLATVFGWVGKQLAPLKGVFQGIGVVIGFLLTGPILKVLGLIPKVGIVFRLMAVPIRFTGRVFRMLTGVLGAGWRAFLKVHTAVNRFVGTFTSMPAKVIRAALNAVGSIIHTFEHLPGKLVGFARSAGSKVVSGLTGAVRSRVTAIYNFFSKIGSNIVHAIVNAIKSAPGQIIGAITSVVPDKLKGAVKHLIPGIATGGVVNRGGVAVVGERGPELVSLPGGSTVYDSRTSRRARAGMAAPQAIYVEANLHLSGKQIHSEVFRVDRALAETT